MSIVPSLEALRARHGHLDGAPLLRAMRDAFGDRLAVISSFGAEAAVLLDLVAQVDVGIPVIFGDSGEHFDETLVYQAEVSRFLGLRDVRLIRPTAEERMQAESLWRTDPDQCCRLRKVQPLERAVAGFAALVDGRKRFHGGDRAVIETIADDETGRIKISPLARWDQRQIAAAFVERRLPVHPLVAQGYRSIGCWPCSRPIGTDEPVRAGRWSGLAKTECGLHHAPKQPVPVA